MDTFRDAPETAEQYADRLNAYFGSDDSLAIAREVQPSEPYIRRRSSRG